MRTKSLDIPLALSAVVAGLMAVQSALGLAMPQLYRDSAWVAATWFGNDLATLVAVVPLLVAAVVLARRGSLRRALLWIGMLGYAAYNYAYLFGTEMNVFFPLYVLLMVLTALALILGLAGLDANAVRAGFSPRTPRRVAGGYLTLVAVGFAFAWLAQWAAYVFGGKAPAIGVDAFKLVAAMDLTVMLPLLGFGGVLLLLDRPWGYVVAPVACAQGALYLLVLTVNSFVVAARGIGANEAAVWGSAMVLTGAALAVLLTSARGETTRNGEP